MAIRGTENHFVLRDLYVVGAAPATPGEPTEHDLLLLLIEGAPNVRFDGLVLVDGRIQIDQRTIFIQDTILHKVGLWMSAERIEWSGITVIGERADRIGAHSLSLNEGIIQGLQLVSCEDEAIRLRFGVSGSGGDWSIDAVARSADGFAGQLATLTVTGGGTSYLRLDGSFDGFGIAEGFVRIVGEDRNLTSMHDFDVGAATVELERLRIDQYGSLNDGSKVILRDASLVLSEPMGLGLDAHAKLECVRSDLMAREAVESWVTPIGKNSLAIRGMSCHVDGPAGASNVDFLLDGRRPDPYLQTDLRSEPTRPAPGVGWVGAAVIVLLVVGYARRRI